MTNDEIKSGIAKVVCAGFLERRERTKRHPLLVRFDNPNVLDVLDEMNQRNLLRDSGDRRDEYGPTSGTFALLGDGHEFYKQATSAFECTIRALRSLYLSNGGEVDYEPFDFRLRVQEFQDNGPISHEFISLGLYLALEFAAIQPTKMSSDQLTVERFRIAERVIRMQDPASSWTQRVRAAREPLLRPNIQIQEFPTFDADAGDDAASNDFFWPLIHPAVATAARPRFDSGCYSDAVEWALKVVAEEVRRRTGLTIDGADLMHKAFSPNRPYLVFKDTLPATQLSLQQGYMEVFAGAMTGIRNPKAHGMVQLDRRRCIHFLFLASLLADKVDEASDAP
ncbi:MAG TPA: TIGR02391 family protein [Terracidiphilus sp.]|jgi:uncharacterized protein (TIGR02391 family)|nr:TIGR02391 family protein [Terracidiphilus sp.]